MARFKGGLLLDIEAKEVLQPLLKLFEEAEALLENAKA